LLALLVALFFDLGVIANTISLGVLFNYSLVDLGLIVKRYENPDDSGYWFYLILALYYVVSLLLGFSIYFGFPFYVWIIMGIILISIIAYFYIFCKQYYIPDGFECPGVPLVPFLGTTTTLLLCGSMAKVPWIFFLIYQGLMLLLYLCYGIWNSELNPKKKDSNNSNENEKLLTNS